MSPYTSKTARNSKLADVSVLSFIGSPVVADGNRQEPSAFHLPQASLRANILDAVIVARSCRRHVPEAFEEMVELSIGQPYEEPYGAGCFSRSYL
jgi:hypothetical protein